MKNFIQRTITGLLFVAILVIAIIEHSTFYALLFTVITALSLHEFYSLVRQDKTSPKIEMLSAIFAGCYFYIVSYLCLFKGLSVICFLPYLLYFIYLSIFELYRNNGNPLTNFAYAVMGHIYIVLPFSLFNLLFTPSLKTLSLFNLDDLVTASSAYDILQPVLFPLALFIFIWLNDTGAYLAGVTFGKHRLFERISPKKSWEGFVGGAILDIVVAIVIAHFCPIISVAKWIGYALVVVGVGTYGDLWESLMKRSVGVKDSGHLLPGHGGMLDRFDSVLLAIPAVIIYLYIVCF